MAEAIAVPQWLTGVILAGVMGLSGWTLITVHALAGNVGVLAERIESMKTLESVTMHNMTERLDTHTDRLKNIAARVLDLEKSTHRSPRR